MLFVRHTLTHKGCCPYSLMRSLCVVCIVVVIASAAAAMAPKAHQLSEDYTFESYLKDFSKSYTSANEYAMRRDIFSRRMKEILRHNANPSQTYQKGVNHMTDWTTTERQQIRGAILQKRDSMRSEFHRPHVTTGSKLPYSIDYREAWPPVLTAVKDQGYCGSCWAHAAVESIETHYAIRTGQLYSLSQQQLTSCTPNPKHCGGTGGCGGNIAEQAWDYVVSNGGIAQEWSYSYASYRGVTPTCNYSVNKTRPVVKLTGYASAKKNDANSVLDALVNAGPLAISVDASGWGDYEGGIFTGCDYAKNISMDHAVQLVGYGHDFSTGLDYWLVRNSWSPAWGENGYIRLHRAETTPCGWNVDNQNGAGCKDDPPVVWACGICGIAYDADYPLPQV